MPFFYYYDPYYWVILLPAILISVYAQIKVSGTFRRRAISESAGE